MTTQTEALTLALEALETCYAGDYSTGHVINPSFDEDAVKDAIIAIEEALAEPEQEPVACIGYWNQKTGAYYKPDQISASHQKLIEDGILRRCYTTPPQRTWVGLTDETLDDVYFCAEGSATPLETWREQARTIEAKLKEKNT